ncbi:hypothetical protein FRC07_007745 [Ceratobasidium sp. 392]|nr:hypothetical protein FRC07_007745 [Ceratobasidium sp. 392]
MSRRTTPITTSNTSLDGKDYPSDKKESPPYEAGGEVPGTVSGAFDGEHIYEDQKLGKYFVPIAGYEGAHRFDPKATWTDTEERAIVRKIDLRITIWCCVMFFALQLDRGNIASALSDNMLDDLKLTTDDFNNGQTIFYLSFMCAELPSQLISKRLGPDVWIPIQLMLWSLVAMTQCKLSGRGTFFATRCLLGVLEGGFIPDIVLFLSYFYKGAELPIRLAFFWVSLTVADVSGALLGYGILQMRGIHGWEGWRYLFLIEGAVTASIGVFSFFWLPASPTQTKGNLRGKDGWFSEREEIIMVNRVLRDDPTKGDMHNRQGLGLKELWASITDYDNWGLYLLGLSAYIPPTPPLTYLTLTLRSLGFSTLNSNLLTIPSSVLFIINNLLLVTLSRVVNERSFVCSIGSIWMLPLLVALAVLPDDTNAWIRYTIVTLLIAYPYAHPILVAWNSQNSGTVRTRTVSAALYNIFVQAGSVISTRIYNESDRPFYHKGNKVLIGICVWNTILFWLVKFYYIQRNKWKAARWNAMTTDEKAHYLETTTDKGNKRLDFVFVH